MLTEKVALGLGVIEPVGVPLIALFRGGDRMGRRKPKGRAREGQVALEKEAELPRRVLGDGWLGLGPWHARGGGEGEDDGIDWRNDDRAESLAAYSRGR